jgi:NhaP-type Na+/H+ or K+/H+ antiporter
LIIDNDDRHAVGEWFYITWLYEVALGITIGTLIGFTVRKVMKFSERKGLIDRQSFVAQYVSLAILTIGESGLGGQA